MGKYELNGKLIYNDEGRYELQKGDSRFDLSALLDKMGGLENINIKVSFNKRGKLINKKDCFGIDSYYVDDFDLEDILFVLCSDDMQTVDVAIDIEVDEVNDHGTQT